MGVICGDICRLLRDVREGQRLDGWELRKELGNLMLSEVRSDSGMEHSGGKRDGAPSGR